MKQKCFPLAFLIFSFFSFQIFPNAGLGASASAVLSPDFPVLVSANFRSDKNPWAFFLNFGFEKDDGNFDLNKISFFADDWFISERISNHLDYFVLWGVSGGVLADKNDDDTNLYEISTGCRFGAGLDFLFFKRHFEIFMQAVWNPYFGVKIDDGNFGAFLRPVSFPVTAGMRILI